MELFFDPSFTELNNLLNEAESHHCMRVKRLKIGDIIGITDGYGNIFKGTISSYKGKNCFLEDISKYSHLSPTPKLEIAFGILKNSDRMEWMVEKLTEMGTHRIQPLLTSRVERKKINTERFNKKAISAVKQSHNPWLPEIQPPLPFQKYLESVAHNTGKYIAHFTENKIELEQLSLLDTIHILIGPEGGFEPTEIEMAQKKGFIPLSLGPNILRTETAAIAAAALVCG